MWRRKSSKRRCRDDEGQELRNNCSKCLFLWRFVANLIHVNSPISAQQSAFSPRTASNNNFNFFFFLAFVIFSVSLVVLGFPEPNPPQETKVFESVLHTPQFKEKKKKRERKKGEGGEKQTQEDDGENCFSFIFFVFLIIFQSLSLSLSISLSFLSFL